MLFSHTLDFHASISLLSSIVWFICSYISITLNWPLYQRQSLSRVWLFVTPWTVAHHGPLSMEFPRQEYWCGLPFPSPGDLPTQGSNACLLHCRQILYHWATWEARLKLGYIPPLSPWLCHENGTQWLVGKSQALSWQMTEVMGDRALKFAIVTQKEDSRYWEETLITISSHIRNLKLRKLWPWDSKA